MDIQWDSSASLMRVTRFATTDTQEELVARGTVRELVDAVLAMPAGTQAGLLLRVSGADWSEAYELDDIRELAARPEYTGAHGAFDTADLASDDDRTAAAGDAAAPHGASGTPAQPPERSETP